jgi:2-succinyl-6-hydroxy-2,4-cyclohexadiene-1-carboxylate synthase
VPETLVLLHGFGGTHRAWDGVIERLDPERYRPLALDLPGHGGGPPQATAIGFQECVGAVLEAAPPAFALCGYSLGGRVALHVALSAPDRVSRLCVIAANPGIEDAGERAARLAADAQLAERLETEHFEDFIESWRTQPLFAADPPAVGKLARADQRRNDPRSLAAAMRGLSTGAMEPLWERLGELSMPVALIAGSRDEKFTALLDRAQRSLPRAVLTVLDGGHGLPLEDPAGVAGVLEELAGLDAEPGG